MQRAWKQACRTRPAEDMARATSACLVILRTREFPHFYTATELETLCSPPMHFSLLTGGQLGTK